MTITPMMQYIQDRILEAVHGCSLEEAREKELKTGCIIQCSAGTGPLVYHGEIAYGSAFGDEGHKYMIGVVDSKRGFRMVRTKDKMPDVEIIGFPPTLSRLLTALKGCGIFGMNEGFLIHYTEVGYWKEITYWKFLNSNGTDATLFDQSQETITAIALLLGRKDKCNELNDMKNGRIA